MTCREESPRFDGLFNFRDLGGHPAAGGSRVKCRRLFRSDALFSPTSRDERLLEELGILTVVDFRDEGEAAALPDRPPSTVANIVRLPIDAGSLMRVAGGGGRTTRAAAMGMMVSAYRLFANDFQPAFRDFFRVVGDSEAAPLLFHCTAGKDRTGFAAALLLSALGVDREIVMADYLASKARMARKFRPGVDYDPVLEPLYTVEAEFLLAAFAVVDGAYGGMESYLANRLGVDCGALRRLYTEDASDGGRTPAP